MATRTLVERITIPLPTSFDSRIHLRTLDNLVADFDGGGFHVTDIDIDTRTITAERPIQTTDSSADAHPDTIEVRLPRKTKTGDRDHWVEVFAQRYPDYDLTAFEPLLTYATLTKRA
jgi:hypothetical protein